MPGFAYPEKIFPENHLTPENDQTVTFEEMAVMLEEGSADPEATVDLRLETYGRGLLINMMEWLQFFPGGKLSELVFEQKEKFLRIIEDKKLTQNTFRYDIEFQLIFILYDVLLKKMVDTFFPHKEELFRKEVIRLIVKATWAAKLGWEKVFFEYLIQAMRIERQEFRQHKIAMKAKYPDANLDAILENNPRFRKFVAVQQRLYLILGTYQLPKLAKGSLTPEMQNLMKGFLPGQEEPDSQQLGTDWERGTLLEEYLGK